MLNLYKLKKALRSETGAGLAELAISFPVALTIVLATIHLSHVLRESNVIVEAARHAARSVSAGSGFSTSGFAFELPGWALTPSGGQIVDCSVYPTGDDSATGLATDAACGYLEEYFDNEWVTEKNRWQVTTSVFNVSEDGAGTNYWFGTVEVAATENRGPVDSLKAFFGLKPVSSSSFPLSRVE